VLTSLGALAAALAFSALAYADFENAVWPTLAFFSWAFLLSRAVIELPVEFGIVPSPKEEEPEGADGTGEGPEGIWFVDEEGRDSSGRGG
jgi:hypothetical protein